jgi:hypothetical protein
MVKQLQYRAFFEKAKGFGNFESLKLKAKSKKLL